MSAKSTYSQRRTVRTLDDMPGLFDLADMDARQPKPVVFPVPAPPGSAQRMEIDPRVLQREDALRFVSFGSGSSGNCSYIGCSEGGILIDAGIDNKTVMERLHENGINPAKVSGIMLTHDHSDHVRYAYALLRANRGWSLYCTPRTLTGLLRRHSISRRIKDYHKSIFKEFEFEVGGMAITPFETSHDGTDNVGFYVKRGNSTFAIATDTGFVTDRTAHYLRRARYVVLEANYDLQMLMTGRYADYLKARIVGQRGHLDNVDAAAFAARLFAAPADAEPDVQRPAHIFLCHLSEDNNTPQLALEAVRTALVGAGVSVGDGTGSAEALKADVQLTALPRFDSSPLYILRP